MKKQVLDRAFKMVMFLALLGSTFSPQAVFGQCSENGGLNTAIKYANNLYYDGLNGYYNEVNLYYTDYKYAHVTGWELFYDVLNAASNGLSDLHSACSLTND